LRDRAVEDHSGGIDVCVVGVPAVNAVKAFAAAAGDRAIAEGDVPLGRF
jgi:hypothetical protein